MRFAKVFTVIFGFVCLYFETPQLSSQTSRANHHIVIAASTLLDGRGQVLHDVNLVIEASKIASVRTREGAVDYDLRGLTVMPGWIDAHVHITWIFGKDGKIP